MTHKEIAIKLALLTNGKTITFDHKSYDDANDIPHLMVDGIRFNVETAKYISADLGVKKGKIMDNRSIGVFDSGLGGLTAVKQISKELPNGKYDL